VLIADQLLVLPDNLFGRSMRNALHIPAFFLLVVVLHILFRSWRPATLLTVALLAGVLLELALVFTARDASAADLLRNLLGILLGLAAVAAWPRLNLGLLAVVTTLVLITALPPARILLAYQQRDALFPQLLAPQSWQLDPLLTGRTPFMWLVPPADTADNWPEYADRKVLQVTVNEDAYPGITLAEVRGDWRGYDNLELSFYVNRPNGMKLTIAVGHIGRPGTARYISASFPAGANVWAIPTQTLLKSEDRQSEISHLIVHSSPDYAGSSFLLGDIQLTKHN
jgi:hypothetical protein